MTFQQHLTHAGVQEQACQALKELACNGDNKVFIAEKGGIPLVAAVLQQHPTHAGVQQQACRELFWITMNDDNQVVIVKSVVSLW